VEHRVHRSKIDLFDYCNNKILLATIRKTKTLPAFKNSWNCTWTVSRALVIALTINILVKHPRSGLPVATNGAIQIVVFKITITKA